MTVNAECSYFISQVYLTRLIPTLGALARSLGLIEYLSLWWQALAVEQMADSWDFL